MAAPRSISRIAIRHLLFAICHLPFAMKELVEHIAHALVDHPDKVNVEMTSYGGRTIIRLHVASDDTGRVIGKDGKVANAMRALLRMMAAREGRRVELDIV